MTAKQPPWGACTRCGTTAEIARINGKCPHCQKGVFASVAVQDWRPCEECAGAGCLHCNWTGYERRSAA
jgi:hypothetical protein